MRLEMVKTGVDERLATDHPAYFWWHVNSYAISIYSIRLHDFRGYNISVNSEQKTMLQDMYSAGVLCAVYYIMYII